MRIALLSYDFAEYCIQHANGLISGGQVMLVLPRELYAPQVGQLDPTVELRTFAKPRLRQPIRQLVRFGGYFVN